MDIDREFRKAMGMATTTSQKPAQSESLTIEKLRNAMRELGSPRNLIVSNIENAVKRLSILNRAEYTMTSQIFGMPIEVDHRVPPDCIAVISGGKLEKVIALTEDAQPAASAYAALRKSVEDEATRSRMFAVKRPSIWSDNIV